MKRPQKRGPPVPGASPPPPFNSLREFYPFYQSQHQRQGTRVMHFVGTTMFLALAAAAVASSRPSIGLVAVVSAYAFAWIGHYFIEHNKPATFKYPLWSLVSDFIMYFNILTGRESIRDQRAAHKQQAT